MTDFSTFPVITTKQLVMRELTIADAPLIHKMRSDKETNALIGRQNSESIGDALLFIDKIQSGVRRNESIYWVISSENSPGLSGTIGLWNFEESSKSAEIGYELLKEYRGQGIMSEVLPAIIRFGFEKLKLKRMDAFTTEQNTGSVRLLRKFGFQLEVSENDSARNAEPRLMKFVLGSERLQPFEN